VKNRANILVVDNDASFIDFVTNTLIKDDYNVHGAKNYREALKEIKKKNYHLVITDTILPGVDGLRLLEKVKAYDPTIGVIFCTNYAGVETAVKALKEGAYDYLAKPVDAVKIRLVIKRCLEQRNIYEENEDLRKTVQLIESCKSISTTFDKEKIINSTLDTFMAETKASLGFFIDCNGEKDHFELLSFKGIDADKIKKISKLIPQFSKSWKAKKENLFHIKKSELDKIQKRYKSLKDGIVIKIQVNAMVKAFIVLLSDAKGGKKFTPKRIKHVSFIAKEAILAFENLEEYLGAKELAYIDDLTNLYNTRYLNHILDREIKRAKRFKKTLVVLFIDLDEFKNVNDTHGHLAGGKVLVEMANILTSSVREIDTIIRYGGDEYIILLSDTEISGGKLVAERIRKAIEDYTFLKKDGLNIKLTSCIGIAAYPKHATTKKELIHIADMAMYECKGTTKNAIYVATKHLKNKRRGVIL
jgi:diguanylate cyclase (GGDEF)-like protein